jgi:hypothetical protein
MTKQEFRQRLDSITKQILQMTDEVSDMLPTAICEEEWAVEYEVPLNIFAFVAQAFYESMEEIQVRLN